MLKNRFTATLFLLAVLFLLPGCYFQARVNENQVGIQLHKGRIENVVGAGQYNGGLYSDLERIDVSTKTFEWADPSVPTSDEQPLSVSLYVAVQRTRSNECIEKLWREYNAEARDDAALQTQVISRMGGIVKDVTVELTFDEMIGFEGSASSRSEFTDQISERLTIELAKFCTTLISVSINDISPDDEYEQLMRDRSNARQEAQVAIEQTRTLEQIRLQEEAKTAIALEIANREAEVARINAVTYRDYPEAYELQRLAAIQGILGDNDKVYFVPQGSDLTIYLSGQGESVPTVPEGGD